MRLGLRELIFLLLLLAMPVAAYFFVFEPRNKQIAEAREEINRKMEKLRLLEDATMTFADMGNEIDKLSNAVEVFEQKLPAEREVEVILKQVWELAQKHKLTQRSLRTDKQIQSNQYAEQPIKMVITGDFDGFYSFLLELERLERITRLQQMNLRKTGKEEGSMQADLNLSIFFEKQNEAH